MCLGPRSLVLEQARNGVPIRMAVLSLVALAGAVGVGGVARAVSLVQRLAVADLVDLGAAEVVQLGRAVELPAVPFVEGTCSGVARLGHHRIAFA